MATVDDFQSIRALDIDFMELLIRENDGPDDLEFLISDLDDHFIAHAPKRLDIGGGTALLDLASPDEELREHSVERIKEIIEVVGKEVPMVIHPGGVREGPFGEPDHLTSNLVISLQHINGRLWLENMPSRYIHEQGVLHCNIMTSPADFQTVLPMVEGITLDTSHAYLSGGASSGNDKIRDFIESLGPHIRHVHLSDAERPSGEGLPLGEGDIDFSFMSRLSHLPILLEIRGGHKEGGEGFKEALGAVNSGRLW